MKAFRSNLKENKGHWLKALPSQPKTSETHWSILIEWKIFKNFQAGWYRGKKYFVPAQIVQWTFFDT